MGYWRGDVGVIGGIEVAAWDIARGCWYILTQGKKLIRKYNNIENICKNYDVIFLTNTGVTTKWVAPTHTLLNGGL